MAYEKQNFVPGQKLTADQMNHIEDGIADAVTINDPILRYDKQTLTEEQQAQARANIGVEESPYFNVTDAGIVSLKPEYRGQPADATYEASVSDRGVGVAGSKNIRLPKHLIIPDAVNGIEVKGIAPGAFSYNKMVEIVSIPSTVTVIPERCFCESSNFKTLYSAEQVSEIQGYAFYLSSLKEANFPNLQTLGDSAFACCYTLESANVGDVGTLPVSTFRLCFNLRQIKGGTNVSTVGVGACMWTAKLAYADFVGQNLRSVEGAAFACSGFNYDWATLTNCTFGEFATSAQPKGTADFWNGLTVKECENQLPTLLCQNDSRWKSRKIGTTAISYASGCTLMAILHAYCGLKGLRLETVEDFESIANTISPGVLNNYTEYPQCIDAIAPALGLAVEKHNTFNATTLQALYNALSEGKYAVVFTAVGSISYVGTSWAQYTMTGHSVLVHGVRADGKLIVADSSMFDNSDSTKAGRYALPYKAFIHPNVMTGYSAESVYILSLAK